MLIVTDGKFETPVRIYHWWPGKEWYKENPIPSYIVKEVKQMGSRYLTYVSAEVDYDRFVSAWSVCCPRDIPSRKMGRKIALGRLGKRLESFDMRMEER